MRLKRLSITVIGLLILCPTWAAKILFVFPYDTPSQCNLLTPYMQALMDRDHQLTLIHAFSGCKITDQVHSIYVTDRYQTTLEFNYIDVWDMSKWGEISSVRTYLMKINLNVLDNQEVKQLMAAEKTYDLMVIEPSHTEGLFGMAEHFNASLMGLAISGADWNLDGLVSYTTSMAFEPILPIGFSYGETLMDRIYNWVLISEEWLLMNLIFLPALRSVHEHFFAHLNQSFAEIRQSFSIILLNQHFSLFNARPNVPSLIEVGGMHVPRELPELPPELAEFIEDAPYGVIYMSLGTEIRSSDLSEKTLSIILDTFAKLPQRIIWKFEGNLRPNVSGNIYMSEWLPQQAILAHPNVRLFISHGGMLSIIEATHYAKPVLGMPLFYDQFHNVECMQLKGAALILDMLKVTKLDFESAIRNLLDQPQYRKNVKELSKRFRDHPMHPLDTAVYWTEYVLRYKGAPHMRISSSNLKILDYYCLDNLILVVLRLSLLFSIIFYALLKLYHFLERRSFI